MRESGVELSQEVKASVELPLGKVRFEIVQERIKRRVAVVLAARLALRRLGVRYVDLGFQRSVRRAEPRRLNTLRDRFVGTSEADAFFDVFGRRRDQGVPQHTGLRMDRTGQARVDRAEARLGDRLAVLHAQVGREQLLGRAIVFAALHLKRAEHREPVGPLRQLGQVRRETLAGDRVPK